MEREKGGLPDVSGGWGDADETRNGTLTGTDDGELALVLDHVDNDPADGASGSSGVGVERGVHGANATVQC